MTELTGLSFWGSGQGRDKRSEVNLCPVLSHTPCLPWFSCPTASLMTGCPWQPGTTPMVTGAISLTTAIARVTSTGLLGGWNIGRCGPQMALPLHLQGTLQKEGQYNTTGIVATNPSFRPFQSHHFSVTFLPRYKLTLTRSE